MANIIWHDRKRYLGLPISFTKYSMSEDRLFVEKNGCRGKTNRRSADKILE